jgi:hypothetical protein
MLSSRGVESLRFEPQHFLDFLLIVMGSDIAGHRPNKKVAILEPDEREFPFWIPVFFLYVVKNGVDLLCCLGQFGVVKARQFLYLPEIGHRALAVWTRETIDFPVLQGIRVGFWFEFHRG